MKLIKHLCLPLAALTLAACNNDDYEAPMLDISKPILINFEKSQYGFTPIFSDYPVSTDDQDNEEFYELSAKYEEMDGTETKAWMLRGNNHSDDLFMGVKSYIYGMKADTSYQVTLSTTFTSNIPSNCFGIGGAPGESVYVKLAASTEEPKNETIDDMHRLNIDIGNQSQSGTNGQTVGNVANGVDCMEDEQWKEIERSTETKIDVQTDSLGGFWMMVGTDSGFEGLTYYYINSLTIKIEE